METLGKRIKHIRGSEPQEAFAARIGISKGSIGGYERDENSPSADAILKICSKANISVEWLMLGSGSIHPGEPKVVPPSPQPAPATPSCENCTKLASRLDVLEEERHELTAENRQLNLENRQLWKENGDLREKCARLEGQGAQDACLPFKKLPNTQSSDRANS